MRRSFQKFAIPTGDAALAGRLRHLLGTACVDNTVRDGPIYVYVEPTNVDALREVITGAGHRLVLQLNDQPI